MSLFINSKVHLPRSCEKCPFNYADMSVGFCTAASKTIDTRGYGRKRHPDCPLIEIPTPHGRLIDADEIEKCVHEWYDVGEYVFADTIRNADTIIEAEVSE